MQSLLKNKKILILAILFIVGVATYGNSFNNEFFWDDDDSIVNNAYIKDWRFLHSYFTENLIAGAGQVTNYWRPVLLISFAIDYHIWGIKPFGFHLTNTLLHIFAAWLVFLIIYLLSKKKLFLSFIVSLLFLIHPLQTEAVVYTAGRADSLSSVFLLLSILFFILSQELKGEKMLWYYSASISFFILGLLTKEQVILLPSLILLIELVFIIKRFDKKAVINTIKLTLPFFLISVVYFIVRLTILNFNNILHSFEYVDIYNNSVWHRLLTFCYVVIEYFKLLFAPLGLCFAKEISTVTSIFNFSVLLFFILLILIIIICIKTWKKNKLITFGFLWFFIILLPRTNIWQINRPMYEHWLYLPMVGFWLALFSIAQLLYGEMNNEDKKTALRYISIGFLIMYLFSLTFLTILRNNDWENPITFYEKNLKYTPNSFIQHNNLGMAYAESDRTEEAIKEYRLALSIADIYPQVHHNLGNSLRDTERIDEAILEYEKAISISPSFILPYNNLLAIYIARNDKNEAEKILKRMEIVINDKTYFLYIKGATYYNLKEYDGATSAWNELLEIEPNNLKIRKMIDGVKFNKIN